MTSDQTTSNKNDLPEERQWQLALASLQRANESTNYLRTLMFVAAGGLIFIVLPEIKLALPKAALLSHVGALALSALVVCLLFYSWHVQRVKARERFNYLRDGKYDAYVQYDRAVETISSKRDSWTDFMAFAILLFGFVLELAARYQVMAIEKPLLPIPGIHV